MGTAELLLALDAGQTRVHAVVVSAGPEQGAITSHLRLGADGDDVSAGAFVTEDGEVLFGDDARQRAATQPERWVPDFVSHVGDRVPLVVGGFVAPAEELVARMVRWAVAAVVAAHGSAPGCIAVTHPTGWRGHRIEALRAALQSAAVGDVLLVPVGYGAVRHAARSGRSRVIAVYDLGGETFEASVLEDGVLAGPPCVLPVGTAALDLALLQQVLALGGGAETRRPGTAGELAASRASVACAKEVLSQRSDAAVALRMRGQETQLRLTRAELEDVAEPMIERTVDALEHALDDAGVRVDQLDEIVLVGGGSRMPLVAQTLSRRMDRPLTAPADPQFAAARGVGLIAWERTADRRRARAAIAPPEVPPPEKASLLEALRAWFRGTRVPYGAATALVAAGVIIAAGMVFGASTPMNESISAAAGADDPDAADDVGVRRASSGFSPGSSRADEQGGQPGTRGSQDDGDSRPQADDTSTADGPTATPGGGFRIAPAEDPGDGSGTAPAPTTESGVTAVPPPADSPPSAEPAPAPVPSPTPSSSTPEPAAEPEPEPTAEPAPEPEPTPTEEPSSDPAPAPTPQPPGDAGPTATPEPTSDPTPESTSEPTPEPTSEPTPDPTSAPTPEPADDAATPTPEPAAPAPEPTLSAEPLLDAA